MESTKEKALFEVAEIQLSYKLKVKASLRPKIESSKDAEKVLRQTWNPDRLEFVEKVSGMSLTDYLTKQILEQAEMVNTIFPTFAFLSLCFTRKDKSIVNI